MAPEAKDFSTSAATKVAVDAAAQNPDATLASQRINWRGVTYQSFFFLGIEHGLRTVQVKTHREFGGRFWHDYLNAVSGTGGWGDGDSIFTNYVAHPMQGGVTGYVFIQNDSKGIRQEFNLKSKDYWKSRLKATGWAAFYSTQFELGPVSEASLGNVGQKRGTMGMVDIVMTPVGGLGMLAAEDSIDKYWIKKLEGGTDKLGRRRFYRMALNPQRTIANLMRLKKPWHRDTRAIGYNLPSKP